MSDDREPELTLPTSRRRFIGGGAAAAAAVAVGGAALASCSTEKSAGGGTAGTTASGAIERRHVTSGAAVLDVKIVGTGTPIILVPGFARQTSKRSCRA